MKDLSVFVVQIAVILLPGIVWAKVDDRFAVRSVSSDLNLALKALVFGIASYAVTYLIYLGFGWPFATVDLAAAEKSTIISAGVLREVAVATLVGAGLSVGWLYVVNYKLLSRLFQLMRATRRYGDEDVWDFTFNSLPPGAGWVNVRDFEKEIVYSGFVDVFSEAEALRELVLRDVEVFDFEGRKLFETPRIYIARKPDDIHIEFP